MDMKGHILAALREQFDRWEALLESLSEEQIRAPRHGSQWTLQDDVAHLGTWLLRSIARMEAAQQNREPVFPEWVAGIDPDAEGNADRVNPWIYQANRDRPWPEVHGEWRERFLRLVDLGKGFSEPYLLAAEVYPWLGPYSLAFVLISAYDHHQEHLDNAVAWLGQSDLS